MIGISEHKIHEGSAPSNNIDITDYQKFVFEPIGTRHGGCFYVKSDLVFKVRKELNLNSPGNFEAMLVVKIREQSFLAAYPFTTILAKGRVISRRLPFYYHLS